jgi:hypothetical protein
MAGSIKILTFDDARSYAGVSVKFVGIPQTPAPFRDDCFGASKNQLIRRRPNLNLAQRLGIKIMTNEEVSTNIDKLRACRIIFRGAMVLGFAILALFFFFSYAGFREQAYQIGAIWIIGIALVVFGLLIISREDRILNKVILEISPSGNGYEVTTIFMKKIQMAEAKFQSEDPAWITKRKAWAGYFLNGAGANAHSAQSVKCFVISSRGQRFFWLTTGLSPVVI